MSMIYAYLVEVQIKHIHFSLTTNSKRITIYVNVAKLLNSHCDKHAAVLQPEPPR